MPPPLRVDHLVPICDPDGLDGLLEYWQLLVNQLGARREDSSAIFDWFDDRLFLSRLVLRGGLPEASLYVGGVGTAAPSEPAATSQQFVLNISLDDHSFARLVIAHRGKDARAIAETERQLQEMEPAVRSALVASRRAIRLLVSEARLAALLEVHARPMLFLDRSCIVIAANAAARASLNSGKGLELSSEGKLKFAEPQDSANLETSVASLSSLTQDSAEPKEHRAVLCFRNSSTEREHHIALTPVIPDTRRLSSDNGPRIRIEPWVAAAICYSDAPLLLPQALLKQTFNLTKAQARMAEALVGGATLKEYAERVNIRMTTARWHLSQILAKTHSRSQPDFVRRVLCLFG
jgi:DNA-binding CsgD family transcriptional regulator